MPLPVSSLWKNYFTDGVSPIVIPSRPWKEYDDAKRLELLTYSQVQEVPGE